MSFAPYAKFTEDGTPNVLCPEVYDDIENIMLTGGRHNAPFSTPMAAAVETNPSAFLVTANSALPVADSIRGFYEAAGLKAPAIGIIRTTERRDPLQIVPPTESEQSRLETFLSGLLDNVVVVDERAYSGETLGRAKALLSEMGVETLQTIAGRWYNRVWLQDLNVSRVTSTHAPKMREIGQKAYLLSATSS
jgi:hypothetical protein